MEQNLQVKIDSSQIRFEKYRYQQVKRKQERKKMNERVTEAKKHMKEGLWEVQEE